MRMVFHCMEHRLYSYTNGCPKSCLMKACPSLGTLLRDHFREFSCWIVAYELYTIMLAGTAKRNVNWSFCVSVVTSAHAMFIVSGNVAYHKTASQSVDSYTDWSRQFPAERAVDGNTNPDMFQGHCAHPDTDSGQNAWWKVDLGETYDISSVIIYNRDASE